MLPMILQIVLGPEFVYEALRTDPEAAPQAAGRTLRFLAVRVFLLVRFG